MDPNGSVTPPYSNIFLIYITIYKKPHSTESFVIKTHYNFIDLFNKRDIMKYITTIANAIIISKIDDK